MDNHYDVIDKFMPINYNGDYNITLSSDNYNYLVMHFNSLRFKNLIVNTRYNTLIYKNNPYALYKAVEKKLLEKPVYVRSIDYNENPIRIVSDTNYKQIFELPIEFFKAINSFLVIDKIRIADNFINETDYCIIFGDNNERFNIRSGETKLLNKEYYKYSLDTLKCTIKGFNIPNQSGEYFTTIIIYYIFNGKHYTITKDIRYIVELPAVLDNEYLIATVTRIDSSKLPEEKEVKANNNLMVDEFSFKEDILKMVLTNLFFGTTGCDLAFPDLK
jgi:hypothetical protein